jgi:2-polyprenyl-6-methoxyphenol hydroxylase-like FAD-dependent oxidoreductase
MNTKPTIIIVGAGIGGLTVALALRQAGFPIHVFERATHLKEIGAGIGLSANAMRVLRHLGVMQSVIDRGTVIREVLSYSWRGELLGRVPTTRTDVPSVCLHRADLQGALFSALPPDCIHLGEEFVSLKIADGRVTAHFAGGRSESADALIGADGLRSRVRAQLIGDGEPTYRGYHCWRGVCDYPAAEQLTESFGHGLRMGVVPMGHRGTAWWCTANETPIGDHDPAHLKSRLQGWFGKWHAPIPEMLGRTAPAAIIQTAICDRRPVTIWSKGTCTLLGDSAHPMTPNLGQGGCMAIEDAAMLARCVSHYPDLTIAFRSYERLRSARTSRVTTLSRYYGVIGQWTKPGLVWLRNMVLRSAPSATAKGYDKFVCYDPWRVSLKQMRSPNKSVATPDITGGR